MRRPRPLRRRLGLVPRLLLLLSGRLSVSRERRRRERGKGRRRRLLLLRGPCRSRCRTSTPSHTRIPAPKSRRRDRRREGVAAAFPAHGEAWPTTTTGPRRPRRAPHAAPAAKVLWVVVVHVRGRGYREGGCRGGGGGGKEVGVCGLWKGRLVGV
ncbi:hypothetical protein C8R46DRAFT_473059 [Mycena filopes]|nr:hypothetical protein C8R46DRAFT_473059 [Mycena filopes]